MVSWGEEPTPGVGGQSEPGWGQAPAEQRHEPDWGQGPPRNQLRPLNLGDVLDGMFRVTREHWRAFLLGEGVVMVGSFVAVLIAGFVLSIGMASTLADPVGADILTDPGVSGSDAIADFFGEIVAQVAVFFLAIMLLVLAIAPFLYGVPVHIAAAGYRTGHVTATDGLRATARRYWALLGALVLQSLVLLGIALVIMVPFFVLAAATGDSSGFGVGVLGYLLAMVAIAFASIRMVLAVPLIMVEQLGPVEAIQRSNALVKGKTLGVFGTLFVVWIIVFVTTLVVMFGSQLIITAIIAAVDSSALSIVGVIVLLGIQLFTTLMVYALIATAIVLVYFDRRVRTEGFDLAEGASELGAGTNPSW